jgi:hypothetical protein
MGDSHRLSLRVMVILQQKHITALEQSLFDFISLSGENHTALPEIIPEDDNIGSY